MEENKQQGLKKMHFSRNLAVKLKWILSTQLLSTTGLFNSAWYGVECCNVIVPHRNVKCCVNIWLWCIHNVALDKKGICILILRLRFRVCCALLFNNSFSWKIKALSLCTDIVQKMAHTHIFMLHLFFLMVHHSSSLRFIWLHKSDSCPTIFFFLSIDGLSRQLFYQSERLAL